MYTIKLDQFEGPLEVLLELIEGQKLEITQISLAKVTDQFLEFLKKNEGNITTAHLANFIVIASRLILIKSKALLPFLELTKDEEEDIVDLEKQLKEYQRFRQAATILKELWEKKNLCFSRERKEITSSLFYPPRTVSREDLAAFFRKILEEVPKVTELPKNILKSKISVEERIKHIAKVVQERIEISFHSLMKPVHGKEHLIANFLAVLELTKQKLVTVKQEDIFGEIKILKMQRALTQDNSAFQTSNS